jgi:chemotaxis family two-component system response regulator Rcp1
MIQTGGRKPRVLIIEDNAGDIGLFRWALEQAGVECELSAIADGGAALEFARRETESEIPDLVILDLNLPKANGREILAAMRSAAALADVPVVIWTSSNALGDRSQLAPLRVTRYLVKPAELGEFRKLGVTIREVLEEGQRARG